MRLQIFIALLTISLSYSQESSISLTSINPTYYPSETSITIEQSFSKQQFKVYGVHLLKEYEKKISYLEYTDIKRALKKIEIIPQAEEYNSICLDGSLLRLKFEDKEYTIYCLSESDDKTVRKELLEAVKLILKAAKIELKEL